MKYFNFTAPYSSVIQAESMEKAIKAYKQRIMDYKGDSVIDDEIRCEEIDSEVLQKQIHEVVEGLAKKFSNKK